MKPNKSILKRIIVTKSGKLLRRKSHLNHFNATESRTLQRRHHSTGKLSKTLTKTIKSYM